MASYDIQEQVDPKYGALSKEMITMLTEYEHNYFREDIPIPFCGLTIYPVKVRNFEEFAACTSCLTLNKNESPQGIRMTNLDYLISKTQITQDNEGQKWSYKIQKLFELIFHIQNGLKCTKCGHIISYNSPEFLKFVAEIQHAHEEGANKTKIDAPQLVCPECGCSEFCEMIKIVQDAHTKKYSFIIDGQEINKDNFNKLRQIVLFQNFYDYVDDSWVDPEVKKDHDEKVRIEQQKNDVHASIEKKVVCLSISTHYTFAEIYDMPIRKFTLALATVDDLINYKIMKQSVMSGFVSLPKGQTIEHWIYKPNKDMYGDSYKSTDEIHNSVSNL